jgi:AcrR family transcriptional regulator
MPPKAKFTKDEIINAALNITKLYGFTALTARALAVELGSSARPIFTVFQSMEDVQREVTTAARELYDSYVQRGLSETPAFKGVGTQYILFSIRESKLFQLLFMSEQPGVPDLSNVLPVIDENYDNILLSIEEGYKLDKKSAQKLYHHLWIYTHGIATLCATKMCRFTGGEISSLLSEVCISILTRLKEGESND